MNSFDKIGLGGGCHWCTEAVFQSLIGVKSVEQGWIASEGENFSFSEAVIVNYDSEIIASKVLIEIHLRTHKSTSQHSMRKKYRSAIYFFNENDEVRITSIITNLQLLFEDKLITQVLPFISFKASRQEITNYYFKNPKKPFCETYIHPKLELLLQQFSPYVKVKALNN